MEGIEGVDSSHAFRAKPFNTDTIEAAEYPDFLAEFTMGVLVAAPAFELDDFTEPFIAVGSPQLEWVVLAMVSPCRMQTLRIKITYSCNIKTPRNIITNTIVLQVLFG